MSNALITTVPFGDKIDFRVIDLKSTILNMHSFKQEN